MSPLVAFVIAVALVPLMGPVGRRIGMVDRPDGAPLAIHAKEVPLTGGVAVTLAGFAGAAFAGAAMASSGGWWLAACVLAALVIGSLDDVRDRSPVLRVAVLGLAGVAGGLWAIGVVPTAPEIAVALGIVLVPASANGVNLVDGADGLAGATGAVAAIGMAAVAHVVLVPEVVSVSAALAGALAGFLVWNRPPARVFLGNGGAYAVGAALGAIATAVIVVAGLRGLVASGLCLGVFAFEVLATLARRLGRGGGITTGDRDHTYDLLARRIGRDRSTAAMVGAGLILAASGVVASLAPAPWCAAIGLAAAGLAGVFGARVRRVAVTRPT